MDNNISKPLVTIWSIVYNQAQFIRESLDGFVMQQTDFPFQVIVHDDASTDGTTDIIMEYAERYPDIIKPMIEKENQWKNGGLKHIIGILNSTHRDSKYLAFCEGDDFWTDPHKLQTQVDFLESHPDYSMCFHSAKKQYECESSCWIDCENIKDKDYDATDIFVNWTIPTASIVCRKEAMDFYAGVKGAERIQNYDIFIILSCFMTGKVRGFSKQMSTYRIQGGGLTYNKKALTRTIQNNPHHFECLGENFPIVDKKYVKWTIAKTYFERACVQDSFKKKIADYMQSMKNDAKCFFRLWSKNHFKKFSFLK